MLNSYVCTHVHVNHTYMCFIEVTSDIEMTSAIEITLDIEMTWNIEMTSDIEMTRDIDDMGHCNDMGHVLEYYFTRIEHFMTSLLPIRRVLECCTCMSHQHSTSSSRPSWWLFIVRGSKNSQICSNKV